MRSRNLKPGFFKNEELAECEPLARILFAGLWCISDRNGVFEYRPKRIKAEILPYDECNIEDLLSQLEISGHFRKFQENNRTYGYIPTFKDHQSPHPNEKHCGYPKPQEQMSEQNQQDKPIQEISGNFTKFQETSGPSSCTSSSLIPDSKEAASPTSYEEKLNEKLKETKETWPKVYAFYGKYKQEFHPAVFLHILDRLKEENLNGDPWPWAKKILDEDGPKINAAQYKIEQNDKYRETNDPKNIGHVLAEVQEKKNQRI